MTRRNIMPSGRSPQSIAVRLEGGLGDHILGMRVLSFVRAKYPHHEILAYSDAAGHETQLQIARMSPLVSAVRPVRATDYTRSIEAIDPADREMMCASDLVIDAWGGTMFVEAAEQLNVPVFDILSSRPQLAISPEAEAAALDFLGEHRDAPLIGLSLGKYDTSLFSDYSELIAALLHGLLEQEEVIILNFFTSTYEFSHWPEPKRTERREIAARGGRLLAGLSRISERIRPCRDLPLPVVAALINRCRYFVGLDNGIKHLAWALDVPLTCLFPIPPNLEHTVRWLPDVHRLLLFDCGEQELSAHLADALSAASSPRRRHASEPPAGHAPVSIRLAGGIGDHLLGMRALSVVDERLPDHRTVVYSDCANHPVQLAVAALSPFAAEVIPVHSTPPPDDFIDACGDDLFTKAAIALRMPLFEFLAVRPALRLPEWATVEAERLLHRFQASSFVGVCFATDEPETLMHFQSRIMDAIGMALGSPDAVALTFFTTSYSFAHRAASEQARCEAAAKQSGQFVAELSKLDARIVPCADLPIELVAALLRRCRYFVGGDNAIKHLAWALDIPRTFFVKERPRRLDILRWMPDVHRMLQFDCPDERLRLHLSQGVTTIAR
jgi:ADP-heptose:LPS heptosyltransferase